MKPIKINVTYNILIVLLFYSPVISVNLLYIVNRSFRVALTIMQQIHPSVD